MKFTLGELVHEMSQGRADTLSKVCSQIADVRASVIESIWNILKLFPEEEFMKTPELPEQLVYAHKRFHFAYLSHATYSPSALKKHLLQILNRLFTASSVLDYLNCPWFCISDKNILAIIRQISSDFSIVMYMFNSLDLSAHKYKQVSKPIKDAVQSACYDFAVHYDHKEIESDVSKANIACEFILKYFVLVEHSSAKAYMVEFLVINATKHSSSPWPFADALSTLKAKRATFFKRVEHRLPEMIAAMFSRFPQEVLDSRHGRVQTASLCWAADHCNPSQLGKLKLDLTVFACIPAKLENKITEDAFISFIFKVYECAGSLPPEAMTWLEGVVGKTISSATDSTDFFEVLLGYFKRWLCPAKFIEEFLKYRVDFISWRRVVASKLFIDFVHDIVFHYKNSVKYSTLANKICDIFEQSVLLKTSVQAGLLRDCKHLSEQFNSGAIVLLASAITFESDEETVRLLLEKNNREIFLQTATLPWDRAKELIQVISKLRPTTDLIDLLFCLSDKTAPLNRYIFALKNIDPKVGQKMLSQRMDSWPIRQDVDYTKIAWLQCHESDPPRISCLKKIINSHCEFSMEELVFYTLSTFDVSILNFACKKTSMEKRLRHDTFRKEYAERFSDFPSESPVLEYLKSLPGFHCDSDDENGVFEYLESISGLRCFLDDDETVSIGMLDFMLSDIVKRIDKWNEIDSEEIFRIPIGLYAQEPVVLSLILDHMSRKVCRGNFVPMPDWYNRAVADIAGRLFPPESDAQD